MIKNNMSNDFISQPRQFLKTAEEKTNDPAYNVWTQEGWQKTPWGDYSDKVQRLATSIINKGINQRLFPCQMSA